MRDFMNISVCMIVKNEEKHIYRALKSIPSQWEVIVVDTGSTDQTLDIIESIGAKPASFRWKDDFSAARNYSLSLATGDYILIMDADEELGNNVDELISNSISLHPGKACTVIINNIMDGEIKRHRMIRVFPNRESFRFFGEVHEQLYYNGKPAISYSSEVTINHYGYSENEYKEKGKAERYLNLYEKHLASHPNDGYMLYQMGKLYYSIKQIKEAEIFLRKSIEVKAERNLYYPVLLVLLGYVLEEQGRSKEAEELLTPYLSTYRDFPDLPFLLGVLAMDTGNVEYIEKYFLAALEIGETTKYTSVEGVGSYKAAYNLGVFYELLGNEEKAKSFYRMSVAYNYNPAEERLKNL
jgi:glycosyltransferase involved in cell wall biosynthesis